MIQMKNYCFLHWVRWIIGRDLNIYTCKDTSQPYFLFDSLAYETCKKILYVQVNQERSRIFLYLDLWLKVALKFPCKINKCHLKLCVFEEEKWKTRKIFCINMSKDLYLNVKPWDRVVLPIKLQLQLLSQ